jgi:hypothetical protein
MRNRDAVGYVKAHGRPVESSKELERKLRQATARLQAEEAAYEREHSEQLDALRAALKAEVEYQVAAARAQHMRNRRKPT